MQTFSRCLIILFTCLSGAFAAPVDNMVSYWDFENNVNDTASVGNTSDNGSWSGTAGFTTGQHGQGLLLDGTNYVSIPSSIDVDRTGSNMSLSTWFQIAACRR